MKIIRKYEENKKTYFSDLKCGEVFLYDNAIWVKCYNPFDDIEFAMVLDIINESDKYFPFEVFELPDIKIDCVYSSTLTIE